MREDTLGRDSSVCEALEREEMREREGGGLGEVRVPPNEGQGCGSTSGSRGPQEGVTWDIWYVN